MTDLTSGKYRLCATADLAGQFTEASAADNTTWVDLELQLSTNGQGGSKAWVIAQRPRP